MTAVIIIVFAIAFFLDYLPVLKAKDNKTIWVYGVLFVSSFVVLVLSSNDNIRIPSPAVPIKTLITSVLKLK